MTKTTARLLLLVILVVSGLAQTIQVQAQDDEEKCAEIVLLALDLTQQLCSSTNRNEACYGNTVLQVELLPGFEEVEFEAPGDRVDLIGVRNLRVSAMDLQSGVWGVALMQVEAANAQESAEVTILLFGNVDMENAFPLLPVIALEDAPIYALPDSQSGQIAELATGDTLIANARLEEGAWVRVSIPQEDTILTGWLQSQQINSPEDLTLLRPLSADSLDETGLVEEGGLLPEYGSMQAVYFQSGDEDSLCPQAPDSGILIQTPEGVAEVNILVNEVDISLTGTAYLEAQPDNSMTVNVLEGSAQIEAFGDFSTAVAGTSVTIPIDENLAASDVPSAPEPYQVEEVQSLPIALLDRPVEIPTPKVLAAGVPAEGDWRFIWGVSQMLCPDGTAINFEGGGINPVYVENDGETLVLPTGRLTRTATGVYGQVYTDGNGNLHRDTVQVTSLDRMVGEAQIDFVALNCSLTVPFEMRLVGAFSS